MSSRRSFHSTRSLLATTAPTTDPLASDRGTKPISSPFQYDQHAKHGVVPVGSAFLVTLAVLFSLLFIVSVTLAFVGAQRGTYFKDILNEVSSAQSGILLLGKSVDIDVDEPSISITWAVVACGADFVLPMSHDPHGSTPCGLPAMPLNVYVDSEKTPAVVYNPELLPFDAIDQHRRHIQSLFQFDSDHVLDVHNQHLYPFDTYVLTSTLRAIATNGSAPGISLPIIRLPVVLSMSSFSIQATDTPSLVKSENNTIFEQSRDIVLHIRRPREARTYVMLLFSLNWAMTHIAIGMVIMTLYHGDQIPPVLPYGAITRTPTRGLNDVLKRLAGIFAIMLAIPQLRGAMPDAPGFDGVLLDSIGYFPQMVLNGLSVVILLLIGVKRELDRNADDGARPRQISMLQPGSADSAPGTSAHQSAEAISYQSGASSVLPPLRKARSSVDITHSGGLCLTAEQLMRAKPIRLSGLDPRAHTVANRSDDDGPWDARAHMRKPGPGGVNMEDSLADSSGVCMSSTWSNFRTEDVERECAGRDHSSAIAQSQCRPLRFSSHSRLRSRKHSVASVMYGHTAVAPPSPVTEEPSDAAVARKKSRRTTTHSSTDDIIIYLEDKGMRWEV